MADDDTVQRLAPELYPTAWLVSIFFDIYPHDFRATRT